ncbi:hypothetical protein BKA08_002281 [Nocardioides marinisabuli]|uniref:Uncharacterized protein n=1 Tax=Nocardioides marinisabuli TaxID=419476 RepID=A0A7Y9JRY5_9ACTN|nr:hypothetical protein [Nocardioides marinisabuli]NYD58043.1 hypothetical protein [Nocardioides marinisabuli]
MTDPAPPSYAAPEVPPGWDKLALAPVGALWAAVQAGDPAGAGGPAERGSFRANLVLTCDDLHGLSFRDWQVGTAQLLPRTLRDYHLIEIERLRIDDLPGGRRLAHHVDLEGRALTMEQWFVREDDRHAWSLTATFETWSYDALADCCADVAAAWRPVSGRRRNSADV